MWYKINKSDSTAVIILESNEAGVFTVKADIHVHIHWTWNKVQICKCKHNHRQNKTVSQTKYKMPSWSTIMDRSLDFLCTWEHFGGGLKSIWLKKLTKWIQPPQPHPPPPKKGAQYHIDSLHQILLLPRKQSLVSFLLNVRLVLINLHAVKSYCCVGGCLVCRVGCSTFLPSLG